jgi:hypothetical protein
MITGPNLNGVGSGIVIDVDKNGVITHNGDPCLITGDDKSMKVGCTRITNEAIIHLYDLYTRGTGSQGRAFRRATPWV